MDAIKVLKTRRSIRSYKDKSIPKDILMDIIDCARLAPSARNEQPWEFIIVTDKEKKKKIAKLPSHGQFIEPAAACIGVCAKKDAEYLCEDCAAATENILLAAKAHNLGSCWVAGRNKPFEKELKKILEIPDDITVFSLIALGYSDEQPEPHNKRTAEEVSHWERF